MSLTVVVTRNVTPRTRGFLASVMLEIAPGVYTAPNMTKGVRERVWSVMSDWFDAGGVSVTDPEAVPAVVMTWTDKEAPGGQRIETLGIPPKSLADADGVVLVNWLQTKT